MAKVGKSKNLKEKKVSKKKLDRIYEKKPLVEFVVAILSVPSIILLLILNFNSIRNLNGTKSAPTPTPTKTQVTFPGSSSQFFAEPVSRSPRPTSTVSSSQVPCNKSLGPVTITSPNEGQTVTNNPVEIDISYDDTDYCSAVWSYQINGGTWSDFDNNSVSLYNLPNGTITFNLRVKSLTSSDTTTLTRDFMYDGPSTVIPSNASGSAH